MSPKQIPRNCKELVALVQKSGFVLSRQRGSHMIFYHKKGIRLTIPNHGSKDLHPKIVKNILQSIESVSGV